MKFNTAFALFVTTMTIDSEFGVAASSASASALASASEELPPRPTRKTKNVKKGGSGSSSSSSTTDAESLVANDCCTTGIGCTDKDDCCYQFGDPDYCGLAVGSDSDGCCYGNCHYPVGRQRCWPWVVPPPKESDCCTTGIGCTENDDCCYQFGDPFYCKLDTNKSGCCVGECTYPDGRQNCNPWVLPRTNKCIPATGDFSGTSVTTGTEPLVPGQLDGLKYPFETCYLYGLMYPCYTESWTDGLGNYYQCHPKNPNEGTAKGNPWSSFQPPSFNTTCGTPCKDLAPATKPCLARNEYCNFNDDCCGTLWCSPWGICGII